MRNLLHANFSRIWRDKVFWGEVLILFVTGVWSIGMMYRERVQYGWIHPFDEQLFFYTILVGCFLSVFCSLFFGTEYSDGTLRNKLIVGHTRNAIYCSGLLACIAEALLTAFAFLVPYCILGTFLIDTQSKSTGQILLHFCISILLLIAFTSLYFMLTMLIEKRSVAAVFCILFFFGMLLVAAVTKARLDEPEMVSGYTLTVNGIEQTAPEPNPRYLPPLARELFQFFFDLLPTGQMLQLTFFSVLHPLRLMLCSAVITAATTGFGLFAFGKKDLK